jgi:hypothetical protein
LGQLDELEAVSIVVVRGTVHFARGLAEIGTVPGDFAAASISSSSDDYADQHHSEYQTDQPIRGIPAAILPRASVGSADSGQRKIKEKGRPARWLG